MSVEAELKRLLSSQPDSPLLQQLSLNSQQKHWYEFSKNLELLVFTRREIDSLNLIKQILTTL